MSKKGGGGGYRAPVEDPNTLQSNQRVTIVDTISEGPIVGLVDGDKSIALNYTPLRTPEGTLTYQGVSWDTRLGMPDQPAYHDVPGAEAEQSVGVEVTQFFPRASGTGSGSVTRQLNNTDATHVRITLMVQGLYEQIVDDQDRAGDTTAATVGYRIVVKNKDGGTVVDYATERHDKTMGQAQWATKFELDGNGPWTITVYKTTADSEKANVKTDLYWSSYTEIVGYPMVYPHTASVLLRGTAETFGGSVPSRCYRVKGLKIQVPSNYDPETRQYAGIWDGTVKAAWTDNPAWVLRDLIMSPRYGLRKFFPPAQQGRELIDKWTLYQLAQYCDQIVPDGFGGGEPRYTFNGQIMGSGEAKEVIQAIASVFHGMTYWSSGMLFARADVPGDPVKLLSQANVIGGLLTYNTGSAQARHSVAVVTWYDPDDYGRPCVETVYDMDAYHRYGYRPIDVTAYGCTSRGQARRQGLWTLLTEDEQWQCTVKVGLDCYDLLPGDFVRVADPTAMGIRFSGRVRNIDGAAVTLDAPVALTEGETYKLAVIMADGKEEIHNVVTRGETDTLAVDAPFTGSAVESALWYISGSDAAPRLFAVRSITEKNDDGSAALELSLREVHLEKYAKLEGEIAFIDTPGGTKPISALPAPTGLTVRASVYYDTGNAMHQRLTFSWAGSVVPGVSGYEVHYRDPGGGWTTRDQITYSIDVTDAIPGDWVFRVRAYSLKGMSSPWAEISYTLGRSDLAPLPPTNLTARGWFGNIVLDWIIPADDPVYDYAEIYAAGQNDVNQAVYVGQSNGNQFWHHVGSFEGRWYWIRAVGKNGIKSAWSQTSGVFARSEQAYHEDFVKHMLKSDPYLNDTLAEMKEGLLDRVEHLAQTILLNDTTLSNHTDELKGTIAVAKEELWQSFTDGLSAEAGYRLQLAAKVNDNLAALQQESIARADADSAMSSRVDTLTSTVGENTTAIQTHASSIDGIKGRYGVRIDSNGYITGFELIGGNGSGSAIFNVDNFMIGKPGQSNRYPFVIGTVDGQQVVSMDKVFIQDAAIKTLKIENNAVTTYTTGTGGQTENWGSGNLGVWRNFSTGSVPLVVANMMAWRPCSASLSVNFYKKEASCNVRILVNTSNTTNGAGEIFWGHVCDSNGENGKVESYSNQFTWVPPQNGTYYFFPQWAVTGGDADCYPGSYMISWALTLLHMKR
ncbi:phage tail protein [Pyramidobacter sp.]|uniref:host specificity protein J n=1 Tax=Pyramidobacter sp. TaxID=1943581 RepID=UPI003319399A